jgi:hypothetical protein
MEDFHGEVDVQEVPLRSESPSHDGEESFRWDSRTSSSRRRGSKSRRRGSRRR